MAEQEVTPNTQQPAGPTKRTPGHRPKQSSFLTTVSLLLRLKDPTHRARGKWVQKQAGGYSVRHSTASDPHHVLLVYKASKYTANLEGVLNNAEGPTEVISWRWGWSPVKFVYNVWVFKEGTFDLHSDGGVINWYWESPSAERRDKFVEFRKLA
ncbi:hypothetical protein Q9L58_010066 [Maublancomyces gigas]|uniref:Uncharacterized protein n=1 Tax=Discina gigas TaxID=1032678 RepID=A0ABR3G5E4_9PEZI